MPSKTRQGLDLLLAEYPDALISKLDPQDGRGPYGRVMSGPWYCVDLSNGLRFAIWKHTGNVYRVEGEFLGGEVEEDPFLTVTPLTVTSS